MITGRGCSDHYLLQHIAKWKGLLQKIVWPGPYLLAEVARTIFIGRGCSGHKVCLLAEVARTIFIGRGCSDHKVYLLAEVARTIIDWRRLLGPYWLAEVARTIIGRAFSDHIYWRRLLGPLLAEVARTIIYLRRRYNNGCHSERGFGPIFYTGKLRHDGFNLWW